MENVFCAVFINRVLMNLENLGFKKALFWPIGKPEKCHYEKNNPGKMHGAKFMTTWGIFKYMLLSENAQAGSLGISVSLFTSNLLS